MFLTISNCNWNCRNWNLFDWIIPCNWIVSALKFYKGPRRNPRRFEETFVRLENLWKDSKNRQASGAHAPEHHSAIEFLTIPVLQNTFAKTLAIFLKILQLRKFIDFIWIFLSNFDANFWKTSISSWTWPSS